MHMASVDLVGTLFILALYLFPTIVGAEGAEHRVDHGHQPLPWVDIHRVGRGARDGRADHSRAWMTIGRSKKSPR
jgi:hypothetical protein